MGGQPKGKPWGVKNRASVKRVLRRALAPALGACRRRAERGEDRALARDVGQHRLGPEIRRRRGWQAELVRLAANALPAVQRFVPPRHRLDEADRGADLLADRRASAVPCLLALAPGPPTHAAMHAADPPPAHRRLPAGPAVAAARAAARRLGRITPGRAVRQMSDRIPAWHGVWLLDFHCA